MRLIRAALYRSGTIQHLKDLWRRDLDAARERAAARLDRTDAAHRAVQQRVADLESEHRAAVSQSNGGALALQALAADVARLAETCRQLEARAQALEQVIDRNRREAGRLRAFRSAIADRSIERHVAARIASAPMLDDPAPMFVVDRFFPDDVFAAFVEAIPPEAAFKIKDRTKADYRVGRTRAALSDLSDDAWRYLEDELIPRTIVPAIAARFAPYVESYYRDLLGESIGTRVAALPLEATDARLMLRRPGYHLEPHLDPKRVLVTGLLYFARRGDDEAYGTSFYRIDGRVARHHASTYYPGAAGHRCDFVRTVPFRPNSGVMFLNSTAHAADLPPHLPKTTERYALQFYVGPPLDAFREILRGLPPADQATWAELLRD